jgi:hypothetical protein
VIVDGKDEGKGVVGGRKVRRGKRAGDNRSPDHLLWTHGPILCINNRRFTDPDIKQVLKLN